MSLSNAARQIEEAIEGAGLRVSLRGTLAQYLARSTGISSVARKPGHWKSPC